VLGAIAFIGLRHTLTGSATPASDCVELGEAPELDPGSAGADAAVRGERSSAGPDEARPTRR
jgi:hypothetical protein